MKIGQESIEGGIKLVLEGELTLNTYPELETVLKRAVEAKLKKVLIDLRKVDYVDSSGLRLLVEYHHQVAYLQGKLILSGLTLNVKKVIEVTRLNKFFNIQDGSDAAAS